MPTKKSSKGSAILKRQMQAQPAPDFRTIYVNSVQIEVSPWDFKFRLGHIMQATTQMLMIEETAHMYMSPQHAKAMLKILSRTLKGYEDKFGTITDVELSLGPTSASEP